MNSKQRELIYVTVVAIIFIIILIATAKPSQIEIDVINGDKTLTCEFSDGWRIVPKEKIVGLNDENGYWSFTNGYARNCEVQ